MFMTCLRQFRVGTQIRRSLAAVDVLCDPLRACLVNEAYALQACQFSHAPSRPLPCSLQAAAAFQGRPSQEEQLREAYAGLRAYHLRHYSSEQPAMRSDNIVVYEGPLSKAVANLKRLSLFSCAVTLATSPLIFIFDTSATSLGAKAGMAATLVSFGVFTTGLLHWFTSPYVHRLVFDRTSQTLDLETLSVLARRQSTNAHISQVAYPESLKPQVTFQAGGKLFYIDPDHFPDKALLAALTPQEPSAAGTDLMR